LNFRKSFSLITLASIILLLLITGCATKPVRRPRITTNFRNTDYSPLDITLKNNPPAPKPAPTYLNDESLKGIVIIVDPGHGGKQPGAGEHTFSPVPEKTINLAIAKKLQTRLLAKGAKVIMSRTYDKFVDLDDRAAMPGRYNANLFVSIHADSIADSSITGTTVYVARNCSTTSSKVARNIQQSFTNSNIKCRGVRSKDFIVLAKHPKPAVLIECGYMTNKYQAEMLNNNWYRNKLATAIAEGIANSF